MKKFLIVFTAIAGMGMQTLTAQSYFKSEYPAVWERANAYTIEVAEAMPESLYEFKPGPESMTFQEQMIHLVGNVKYICGKITGNEVELSDLGDNPDKETIVNGLREAYYFVSRLIAEIDEATLREKVSFGGGQVSKETLFYLIRDHMAHHRGQAVLYLRLNDVKPPRYSGW